MSEEVTAAAATARQVQKEWAKVSGPTPGDVLREFSRLIGLTAYGVLRASLNKVGHVAASRR